MSGEFASKAALRIAILAARRAVPAATRRAEAHALRHHVLGLVSTDATVCAYVPVGSEPGSTEMLDALVAASVRVLLPVARDDGGSPQPLRWAPYQPGALSPAPFGLREPAEPWLPAADVATADVILVPALAVDRTGCRLGRGAGYYDRSLTMAASTATLVAVVRDDEVVERIPAEGHDVSMTHALTPGGGLLALG